MSCFWLHRWHAHTTPHADAPMRRCGRCGTVQQRSGWRWRIVDRRTGIRPVHLVLGGRGAIGQAVRRELLRREVDVLWSSRSYQRDVAWIIDLERPLEQQHLPSVDVIHLVACVPIAAREALIRRYPHAILVAYGGVSPR